MKYRYAFVFAFSISALIALSYFYFKNSSGTPFPRESAVGSPPKVLETGTLEGFVLTYEVTEHVSSSPGVKLPRTLEYKSYYYKNGSLVLDVPLGVAIFDSENQKIFFFEKSTGRFAEAIPDFQDHKRTDDGPSSEVDCEFMGMKRCTELATNLTFPTEPFSVRIQQRFFPFSEALGETSPEYLATIENVKKLFGDDAIEAKGLSVSIHASAASTKLLDMKLKNLNLVNNLESPRKMAVYQNLKGHCKLQPTYICQF